MFILFMAKAIAKFKVADGKSNNETKLSKKAPKQTVLPQVIGSGCIK